jgi:glycosyltransferase involved in cell wall biosynthesis
MRILFLTMSIINDLNGRGIYIDLLNYFKTNGHEVCIISPKERREGGKTILNIEDGVKILRLKTFNLVKTSIIEKGVGQLLLENQFLGAVKNYFSNDKFDLVLYSTPPITFTKAIEYIKKRDNAFAYLLLKDIFPQNAVDMGLIKPNSFIHSYFRRREKRLYDISDAIGCMSVANTKYLIEHNIELNKSKVEVNPNSVSPIHIEYSEKEKNIIRHKYGLPVNKRIFVYGGNLGIPQGIDFLIDTIKSYKDKDAYFLIVGNGTEYFKLKNWFDKNKPNHAALFKNLPKEEYDKLLGCCDVGLIFLDQRFTIPNFPSRLLSYLEMKMPVITATDTSTDIGFVIEEANCGISVQSGNITQMLIAVNKLSTIDLCIYKKNAWKLLNKEYRIERTYNLICEKISQ